MQASLLSEEEARTRTQPEPGALVRKPVVRTRVVHLQPCAFAAAVV